MILLLYYLFIFFIKGAGKGYWAKMLSNRNVDIIAYDKYLDKDRWFNVIRGNSNILKTSVAKNRNLFLCYPDDSENLGRNFVLLNVKCILYFILYYMFKYIKSLHI